MDRRRTYWIATKVEMHLWMIRKGLERLEGLGRHADDHGLLGFRPDCISLTGMNVKRQGPTSGRGMTTGDVEGSIAVS